MGPPPPPIWHHPSGMTEDVRREASPALTRQILAISGQSVGARFDLTTRSFERLPPRLDRKQAQIAAVETQRVEGHERGLRSAALGHERSEVAPAVLSQRHRLAVDQRPLS